MTLWLPETEAALAQVDAWMRTVGERRQGLLLNISPKAVTVDRTCDFHPALLAALLVTCAMMSTRMGTEAEHQAGRTRGGLCRGGGSGDRPAPPAGPRDLSDAPAPFQLDDEQLAALNEELLYCRNPRWSMTQGAAWSGRATLRPLPPRPLLHHCSTGSQARAPLAYTPPYLAEKILTSRSALEGERKQVTVFFADIKDSTSSSRASTRSRPAAPGPGYPSMMDAVHRYEGHREPGAGRWHYGAVWGAPLPMRTMPCGPVTPPWPCRAAIRHYADEVRRTHGTAVAPAGGPQLWRGGGARHWQRPAHGLFGGGPDHAPGGAHGATGRARHIRLTAATLRLVEGLVRVTLWARCRSRGSTRAGGGLRAGRGEHAAPPPPGRGGAGPHPLCRARGGTRRPAPGARPGRARATAR